MSAPVAKLFLLDGMALVYRAHFALAAAPIRTAAGRNTSAIYGFTNTLLELLTKFTPSHLAVVFDTAAPTARHTAFPAYKEHREEMPEELSTAIPDVKRLIRAFHLPALELDGYEADDLIGTLAREAESHDFETYMVTPDKDFGQLVTARTFIYRPSRMGDNPEILGVAEVLAKWGVARPEQVIDILGLWGDTSDNIPGVPGIGEKTAQKLITQYGSIENLLEHAEEQKGKLRESLLAHREQALLSKRLATIDVHAPFPFHPEQLKVGPRDEPTLRALFTEFEFNTLGRRLFGESFKAGRGGSAPVPVSRVSPAEEAAVTAAPSGPLKTIEEIKPEYRIVHDLDVVKTKWQKAPTLALAFRTTREGALSGVAFSLQPGQAEYLALTEQTWQDLIPLLTGRLLVGHEVKSALRCAFFSGHEPLRWFDTALAHALIFPDLKHTLAFTAESLLQYSPLPAEEKNGQQDFLAVLESSAADELQARRTMEQADLALQLHAILEPKLKGVAQEHVFYEIESPLLPVLAAMEREGIRLDPAALKEVEKKLVTDLARLETSIHGHAGMEFNLNSPRQLGELLFGKLALVKDAKKTKTGQYATDEQTLVALAPLHPVIGEILEYREASKLLSTYVQALPGSVAADGRIHTTYQQLATSTGRLNSQDPNLQNIPIRTVQGREVRRAFVPRSEEFTLLSADYSQIELRILAALTQDPGLLEALTGGEDIHRATAAKVYGLSITEVTKEHRSKAKMVNYGISYGMSAFGLAQRLGIARGEARDLIEGYFAQFPGIKNYMTATVEQARERGYVETITGRRRYLPDLRSGNATVRAAAERNAINMPIQGSSADLIKLAMVAIAEVARKEAWQSRLLLQVHDELVFDLHLSEQDRVPAQVQACMIEALPKLQVPIVVELGTGPNWLTAH